MLILSNLEYTLNYRCMSQMLSKSWIKLNYDDDDDDDDNNWQNWGEGVTFWHFDSL